MRSTNPALRQSLFHEIADVGESKTMTIQGTVLKSLIAVLLVMLTAGITWIQTERAGFGVVMPVLIGGMIVGGILSLATIFKPTWAPFTTPLYALAEGCILGAISAVVQAQFPRVPIVFQACSLTFGTALVMLIAYQTGLIRVTQKLRAGIMMATLSIMLLYLASFVLRLFGVQIPFIHQAGMIGIGFSVFVTAVAAFNLLLDFDTIERLSRNGAPKSMEWYGAFALLVTLIWLYIEFLRLLSKLNRRN
ncbi:MAG: Bax inhibitor-1/YccA family protein [Planctomycetaceae bacterium]|nr:Bax inhibitor-1/YccA family protein [Planctomycetaceae bacterium]